MKFESVKCDECQRVKGEANHWLRMFVSAKDPEGDFCVSIPTDGILTMKHDHDGHPAEVSALDLCGQSCALKLLAKLLGWSTPGVAE